MSRDDREGYVPLTEEQRIAIMKHSAKLRREQGREKPLDPDDDFSWENTDFKDYDND